MPVGEAEQMYALALVFAVHVIGGLMLVWALLDDEQRTGWRNPPRPPRPPRGGDDGPPQPPPQPPRPPGARTPTDAPPPLPLAVTAPSGVRLREPGRAADGYPRPVRRPEHEPQPQRAPVPARRRRA